MGAFLEMLRRLGSATADAAAGFLLSEDPSAEREEPEEEEQQSLIDVPADSAEIKEEHVRDSPWTPFVKILRNLWTKRDRVTITVRGLPLPPRLQVARGWITRDKE
jgi:hypothetical protein